MTYLIVCESYEQSMWLCYVQMWTKPYLGTSEEKAGNLPHCDQPAVLQTLVKHAAAPLPQDSDSVHQCQDSESDKHVAINTHGKPFVCNVCSEGYTCADHLKSHMIMHSVKKRYVCDMCGEVFYWRKDVWVHSGQNPFVCCKCSPPLKGASNLTENVSAFAGSFELHRSIGAALSTLVCTFCSNSFNKINNVQFHMKIHERFACGVCSKSFRWSYHLQRHMRTHRNRKQFSCDICSETFSSSVAFKKHVITHKSFVCDVCSKEFNLPSMLKQHMRVHTEDKSFVCDVCYKKFSMPRILKKHMRTHTGEKPFLCELCGKGFGQFQCLNRHIKTHLGLQQFMCNVCNRAFTRVCNLRRHIKRTHTGEVTK